MLGASSSMPSNSSTSSSGGSSCMDAVYQTARQKPLPLIGGGSLFDPQAFMGYLLPKEPARFTVL